ncbi:glycerophosphodiester phosphodiesterase [Candidatus Manganitrophus noduliformans]|uniref:Glycerophosphodiester phosphodiesterase n=1 Tax=Candidatus Manganitrophus noduliformans TaxID=2606439 RepID=A0A7X6IBS1_9BACT|nr:glycerophosphodiester phosphodiesterase family protein [Candidatus Manganitrophus noduliformans]NKE71740.1 glycerophosphodiester phosphodiesterase [Candidatus Manganitrophus noduliformans]
MDKKIIIWAHRGASGHAPENTLVAFQKAMAMGADGIECDLRESREGDLVVFHDPTIKRLTGQSGRVVDLTLSELKRLDIGSWFSPSFAKQTVLTAAELIDKIPPPFLLNLEIKAASPQKVVDLIQKKGIVDRVIVSSFDHILLKKVRSLHPTLPIGYLVDREPLKKILQEARRLEAVSIHLASKRVTPDLIEIAHKEGFKVYAYTVNEPSQMNLFMGMGIDGLFTNYPDRLAEVLSKKKE